ncbi:hypothetical protein Pelo_9970 [Pelomyxa schiedti]|nr:hypothetical protein Pelo_9970 [Pelomyxa schiedti]
MPVKDSVCGLCLGLSSTLGDGRTGSSSSSGVKQTDLVSCTSPSCPFVFCRHCVDNIATLPNVAEPLPDINYTFEQLRGLLRSGGVWRCWVCLACERFSRPREREAVVDIAAQKLTISRQIQAQPQSQSQSQQQAPPTTSAPKKKTRDIPTDTTSRKRRTAQPGAVTFSPPITTPPPPKNPSPSSPSSPSLSPSVAQSQEPTPPSHKSMHLGTHSP